MSEAGSSTSLDPYNRPASKTYGRDLSKAWYEKQKGKLHPFVAGELEAYRWFAYIANCIGVRAVGFKDAACGKGFTRQAVYHNTLLRSAHEEHPDRILTLVDYSYVEHPEGTPRAYVPGFYIGAIGEERQCHFRQPLLLMEYAVWGTFGGSPSDEVEEELLHFEELVSGQLQDPDDLAEMAEILRRQGKFTEILKVTAEAMDIGEPLCPPVLTLPEFIVPVGAYEGLEER